MKITLWVCFIFLCFSSKSKTEFVYLNSSFQNSIIFKEGNYQEWILRNSKLNFGYNFKSKSSLWQLHLAYKKPYGKMKFTPENYFDELSNNPAKGRFAGKVYIPEEYFKIDLVLNYKNKFKPSLFIKLNEKNRQEYGGSFYFNHKKSFSIKLNASHQNLLPKFNKLLYVYKNDEDLISFEGGQFEWDTPYRNYGINFKTKFRVVDEIKIEFQKYDFIPKIPDGIADPEKQFEGLIDGSSDYWNFSVYKEFNGSYKAKINFLTLDFDNLIMMHESGMKFSHFGEVLFDLNNYSMTNYYKNYQVSLSIGDAQGVLNGTLEAWPFLDGFLRFLGERRHVNGSAKLNWRLISFKKNNENENYFNLDYQIDYGRVYTDVIFKSWRPLLFGFGVDDLRIDKLKLLRADLLNINLSPQYLINSWLFKATISQVIPLNIKEGTDDDSSSDPSITHGKVWGGFSMKLQIQKTF